MTTSGTSWLPPGAPTSISGRTPGAAARPTSPRSTALLPRARMGSWEHVVYTRFLDLGTRKEFFGAFKELEDLWEILSPSAELRDHIDAFKRLTLLYAAVRNAYSDRPVLVGDLAVKTRQLVQGEAASGGLGLQVRTVTFDVRTVKALQDEAGPVEAKVFNLVRGLRQEVETTPRWRRYCARSEPAPRPS